jgi:hypothetical protein
VHERTKGEVHRSRARLRQPILLFLFE